jgi:hypothetical protein
MRESISSETAPQTDEHVRCGSASLVQCLIARAPRGRSRLEWCVQSMTDSRGIWPFKTASRAFKASRRVVSIAASLLTAVPASALACPVCGFIGTSDNTWAYQAMSAMLTLLPLAMIGAGVWWLVRLVARADTERPPARSAGKQILPLARRSHMLVGPEAKPR